jgi:hypothetical protein
VSRLLFGYVGESGRDIAEGRGWSAFIGKPPWLDDDVWLSSKAWRFLCVRGRDGLRVRWGCGAGGGGGDERTARRFAGPEDDNPGVAQVSDHARFRGGMRIKRTRW